MKLSLIHYLFFKHTWRQLTAQLCFAFCIALISCNAHALKAKNELNDLNGAKFSLQWTVLENVFSPGAGDGRSRVQLKITNKGTTNLPTTGWHLYFNAIAGVDLNSAQGPFSIEQSSGTLFQIQPRSGFPVLKPSESYDFVFDHPEVMLKLAKAPTGPYLVFDDQAHRAIAISDYQKNLPNLPKQVAMNAKGESGLFSPQQQFDRHANTIDVPENLLPPIFPRPLKADRSSGYLTWNTMPQVVGDTGLASEIKKVKSFLQPYFGNAKKQGSVQQPNAELPIRMRISTLNFSNSPEAYEITVDPQAGVTVQGQTAAGVARGIQSLREMLPLQVLGSQTLTLPAWRIQDAPRFEYRGLLLDVARNFQSKDAILRLLDLMARYKLNQFHFHLTDDEGWRIEIPGLPELTQFGGRRGHGKEPLTHLPPAYGSGPHISNAFGSGHYTAKDYIEILKHAKALHIEVIPEIEMPGHSRAAVKAMQYRFERWKKIDPVKAHEFLLHDIDDLSKYRSAQNYTDNVMDPGLSSTFHFIEHVVDHMRFLHAKAGVPLKVLHMGADELPLGAWHQSPSVARLQREKNITDFNGVWNYFYNQVDQMLVRKGIQMAGWEELGAERRNLGGANKMLPNPHFIHRNFKLYVWNNLDDSADLAYRLANSGYQVILAPATSLYFDMSHNANPEEPGVNWARYVDLQTVFNFDPLDMLRESPFDQRLTNGMESLTPAGQKNIVGLQATLFSETVTHPVVLDNLLMPRMLALAERAWSPAVELNRQSDADLKSSHVRSWSVFVNQVSKKVLPKLDQEIKGVLYRLAPPGVSVQDGMVHVNHELPGMQIRYTTDGTVPLASSPLIIGPMKASSALTLAAFSANGRSSRAVKVMTP